MKTVTCFFVFLLVFAYSLSAQSIERINSNGSNILVTIWSPEASPAATVLLVPGWASGPSDVLGIGSALSSNAHISVVVLTPRGWHDSEGSASFANGLTDIKTALKWIRSSKRSDLNADNIVIGGHSWGGGMSLSYAAKDSSVKKIFSIGGTDHGTFIRKYDADSVFATQIHGYLVSTAAPNGPIRFSVDKTLTELREEQDTFGLIENAQNLADRTILIIGGWEDRSVTIDEYLLPLYRALKSAGVDRVTFKTYHASHGFESVRDQMYGDLAAWIQN